jgi:hypothetical protein
MDLQNTPPLVPPSRLGRFLGWLGIVTGCLGCIGFFVAPYLIRFQAKAKFSDFLDQPEIDQFAALQIQDAFTTRWIAFVLSCGSLFLGYSLIKGKAWVPWPWLVLCACWVGYFVVGNSWAQMSGPDVFGACFRIAILALSIALVKRQRREISL